MTQCYIGEIRPFAGNFAPLGWAFCDGSLQAISNYPALFNLIGTTYGGDGQTTFGLPDLRGRAVIHQGQGTGLSQYVMGERLGTESVTVSTTQMANHTHSFGATTTAGNSATPGPTVILASSPTGHPIYDGAASPIALSGQAVTMAGGSLPHENRQPYQAITYIIALEGIYPSQG
jgi:microcystin-dependent protein